MASETQKLLSDLLQKYGQQRSVVAKRLGLTRQALSDLICGQSVATAAQLDAMRKLLDKWNNSRTEDLADQFKKLLAK